ncbi:hypothetical protein GCK32_000712 [Trichostrongylus colubriformis]|uniref:Uncharacterized protein n=1 Tax=Trichostrongylus colubriformis TaxID=6319 RepID=A0AAN8F195_TRICO
MSSQRGGRTVPVAMGEPDPALVEKAMRKHHLLEGKRREERRRTSFVAWAYGHLELGKRYELPACVRAAIIAAYPSRSGDYVGSRPAREQRLECDDDE